MSLLFKLQGSLFFLRTLNSTLNLILKTREAKPSSLNDPNNAKKKGQLNFVNDPKLPDNFQYFVEKMAPAIVRLNFSKIKLRCVDYLGKLMAILHTNYGILFAERQDLPPFDVFDTLHTAYQSAPTTQQKSLAAEIFEKYRKSKVLGGKRFKGEVLIGRLSRS